jgi:hypothetical protein
MFRAFAWRVLKCFICPAAAAPYRKAVPFSASRAICMPQICMGSSVSIPIPRRTVVRCWDFSPTLSWCDARSSANVRCAELLARTSAGRPPECWAWRGRAVLAAVRFGCAPPPTLRSRKEQGHRNPHAQAEALKQAGNLQKSDAPPTLVTFSLTRRPSFGYGVSNLASCRAPFRTACRNSDGEVRSPRAELPIRSRAASGPRSTGRRTGPHGACLTAASLSEAGKTPVSRRRGKPGSGVEPSG